MKRFTLILSIITVAMLSMAFSTTATAQLTVNGLESRHYPPVLSWVNNSSTNGAVQTAYQVQFTCNGRTIWDSGKIQSSESINIKYKGPKLASGTKYRWRVRTWDGRGRSSRWSAYSTIMTDQLDPSGWKAKWIEPDVADDYLPILRKEFRSNKEVASATAYITAYGLYEAYINGKKVGDALFTPGWTSYDERLQYQTYDVTNMIKKGSNAFGAILGKGWCCGRLVWQDMAEPFYKVTKPAFFAQLVIKYTDGTSQTIVTDESWKSSKSGIVDSEIYDGETINGRKRNENWKEPGIIDGYWQKVIVKDYGTENFVPTEGPLVKVYKEIKPVRLITTPKGEKVIDFGQNISGTEVLVYHGRPEQVITIQHAESLDKDGNFYTTNLRSAKATSTFICSGFEDTFAPKFTWYGFRYIKVEGMKDIDLKNFKAIAITSDVARTGEFKTSDKLVNQLQSNIEWSQADNFIDVPTDCPQRDERLGWTGDAEVFFRTASFNRDVQDFFYKWIKDLASDTQKLGGCPPDVSPHMKGLGCGHTGWADAITIIPWQHYMAYGDPAILEAAYPAMKAWVEHMAGELDDEGLWAVGWHYGDWLFYSVDNDTAGNSAVSYLPLIQQCFYTRSADILAQTAKLLGNKEDEQRYTQLAADSREAFCRAYLTPAGFLVSSTQTAYTLAICFDMVPKDVIPVLGDRLAKEVQKRGHLTTGFLGTPHLCHALTKTGHIDLAYKLLERKTYPGWLYPVTMGATTIWERWNTMMPDGSIPDNGMNSFNHYSYGAVGDWLYRECCGIHETSPAFKTFEIAPKPSVYFTSMSASEQTPYGKIVSSWTLSSDNVMKLNIEVPVGTRCDVILPDGKKSNVGPGKHSFSCTVKTEDREFEQKLFTSYTGEKLLYNILLPVGYDEKKQYPLLLFLHGSGERGNDNTSQLIHGRHLFASDGKLRDVIVIAPQCPEDQTWALSGGSYEPQNFPYESEMQAPLRLTKELMDDMVANGHVDGRKIYCTGLSMGGLGVLDFVMRYPYFFAAAEPICGGVNIDRCRNYKGRTAFRFFHGLADKAVIPECSIQANEALKSAGANTTIITYPGVTHGSWNNAFAESDFISWLLAH